jgi:hypothetical protein
MEKLDSEGADYHWLDQKKYPAAIGLLVDHICSLFQHKKPTNSAHSATPETVAKQEAMGRYRAFFSAGSLVFTFGMDVNEKNEAPSPHYHMLWKAKASSTSIGNYLFRQLISSATTACMPAA